MKFENSTLTQDKNKIFFVKKITKNTDMPAQKKDIFPVLQKSNTTITSVAKSEIEINAALRMRGGKESFVQSTRKSKAPSAKVQQNIVWTLVKPKKFNFCFTFFLESQIPHFLERPEISLQIPLGNWERSQRPKGLLTSHTDAPPF